MLDRRAIYRAIAPLFVAGVLGCAEAGKPTSPPPVVKPVTIPATPPPEKVAEKAKAPDTPAKKAEEPAKKAEPEKKTEFKVGEREL